MGEGMDKERFLIFDFCNNFEFFRVNKNGSESGIQVSLSEKIYNTRAQICRELQAPEYTTDEKYVAYRNETVDDLREQVVALNDNSFMVKRHLRFVEIFREMLAWQNLETKEISDIKEHIAPLVKPQSDDELAKRFDYLIYSIDLGMLQSKNVNSAVRTVIFTAQLLSHKYTIPQVKKEKETIELVQTQDFWDNADIMKLNKVREALRELLKYLDRTKHKIYYVDFPDVITEPTPGEPIGPVIELENYKIKVENYLKEHEDNLSVFKLRNNKTLTEQDMKELERILWIELGTKEDYQKEFGDKPVGRLVRQIVGVDRDAVNEAFSKFLSDEHLNVNQIRFVNLIIDYIVKNGNIEDNSALQKEPFKSVGSITILFKDDMTKARELLNTIEQIKENSEKMA